MKLWLLRPHEQHEMDGMNYRGDSPWNPWYDNIFGFVVRAESEERARALVVGDSDDTSFREAWLDPQWSYCIELSADGDEEIILTDERWA